MAMMAVMSKAAKTKAAVVTMVVAAKPKRNERNSITIAITITIRAAIVPVMTTVMMATIVTVSMASLLHEAFRF